MFSRRAYHQSRFTHNRASTTRHLRFQSQSTFYTTLEKFRRPTDWASEIVREAEGGDIIVFVHGFNTDQQQMIDRMVRIETGLRQTGSFSGKVVGFDWPSDGQAFFAKPTAGRKRVLSYHADRDDADFSANYLMPDGLSLLRDAMPDRSKLHVIAHSMGTRVVTRSFERSSDVFGRNWQVGECVFVASDIDAKEMERGNAYARTMEERTRRLTNYYCRHDDVLDIARDVVNNGRDRLGAVGLPDLHGRGVCDVDCAGHYSRTRSVIGDMLQSHKWQFDDRTFYADLAQVLTGQSQSADRAL